MILRGDCSRRVLHVGGLPPHEIGDDLTGLVVDDLSAVAEIEFQPYEPPVGGCRRWACADFPRVDDTAAVGVGAGGRRKRGQRSPRVGTDETVDLEPARRLELADRSFVAGPKYPSASTARPAAVSACCTTTTAAPSSHSRIGYRSFGSYVGQTGVGGRRRGTRGWRRRRRWWRGGTEPIERGDDPGRAAGVDSDRLGCCRVDHDHTARLERADPRSGRRSRRATNVSPGGRDRDGSTRRRSQRRRPRVTTHPRRRWSPRSNPGLRPSSATRRRRRVRQRSANGTTAERCTPWRPSGYTNHRRSPRRRRSRGTPR